MAGAIDSHFFEGTEKLLELWFAEGDDQNTTADLRDITREQWELLLKHVHCEIISEKSDPDMVSYILSESSMFVSKNRFILKTCGTTTLLLALKPLLKLVKERCGNYKIDDVFYSRKKFMRPDLQHKVHQNFEDEVELLDNLFEHGAAYALGRINRDCWYLYTIDSIGVEQPDQTLELLMTRMDPEVMKLFSQDICQTGMEATERSGINGLIPGTIIDAHMFDPCGYSMNGLLPKGQYFTIHVTPEPKFSYVSFETNVPMESYDSLVSRILSIFKPRKFLMTIFANTSSVAVSYHRSCMEDCVHLNTYKRDDHQFCQFKNYNLTYSHFSVLEVVDPTARPDPAPPH